VINYDLWTGVRKDAYKKDPNYEKEFQEFWDYYHETTQMRIGKHSTGKEGVEHAHSRRAQAGV
jgi:hypothetical protein